MGAEENATADGARSRAEDEAATWLVLLSERPVAAGLRAQFEAWRDASALNAEIWARTSRAYGVVGHTEPRHRRHWEPHRERHAARASAGRARMATRRRIAMGAAVAAMAAVIAIALMPPVMLRLRADVVTATGETRSVTLADGSQVSLAPESAIAVDFAGGTRRIALLRGEAFFEVTHDPSHPLSAAAGGTVATVLGTAFDMRRADGTATVAVQRGHVRVRDDGTAPVTSEDLLAGDWVRVTARGPVRGTMPPDDIAGWRRGTLVARDRPASEIVDALRPYFHGVILVRDDAFAARRVSGLYDLRDPEDTLRELAASHAARMRRISPWLLLVTAG
jgi:transmembrane sensor